MVYLKFVGPHDAYMPLLGANEDKIVTEEESKIFIACGWWVVDSKEEKVTVAPVQPVIEETHDEVLPEQEKLSEGDS